MAENWLIEGDLDKKETEGNQVNIYEIDPSPMSKQMQNGKRQVTKVLDT